MATLNIGVHNYKEGDEVLIEGVTSGPVGVGADSYNGTVIITDTGGSTISYANVGDNETSQADTGGTVTMVTRWVVAEATDNIVELRAGQVGTALNDFNCVTTVTGAICVDRCVFDVTLENDTSLPTLVSVSALALNGVNILTSPVVGATTLDDLVLRIAARCTGYSAVAIANRLYVSRSVTGSAYPSLDAQLFLSTGGGVVLPDSVIQAIAGPDNLTFYSPAQYKVYNFTANVPLYVLLSGGEPPYTYKWSSSVWTLVSGAGALTVDFAPSNTSSQPTCVFSRTIPSGGLSSSGKIPALFQGTITCEVSDQQGRKATSSINARVSFYGATSY